MEMTMRKFMEAIVEGTTVNAELADYAAKYLVKMDEKNEKRKTSPAALAKMKENEVLSEKITNYLATVTKPVKASIIAQSISGDTVVSTSKVSALLRKLVDSGEIKSELVRNNSRTYLIYSIA